MTNEELFIKAKNGCKQSEDQLYQQTQKLIYKIARKLQYIDKRVEFDDLCSIGNIGWTQGYRTYDIEKNIKFSTYVSVCAKREMLRHFNSLGREMRNDHNLRLISLNESAGDSFESVDMSEVLELPNHYGDFSVLFNDTLINEELNTAISELLSEGSLSKLHLDMLMDFIVSEKNGAEIGRSIGLSRQRINIIMKNTLNKIKEKIESKNYDFDLLINQTL